MVVLVFLYNDSVKKSFFILGFWPLAQSAWPPWSKSDVFHFGAQKQTRFSPLNFRLSDAGVCRRLYVRGTLDREFTTNNVWDSFLAMSFHFELSKLHVSCEILSWTKYSPFWAPVSYRSSSPSTYLGHYFKPYDSLSFWWSSFSFSWLRYFKKFRVFGKKVSF